MTPHSIVRAILAGLEPEMPRKFQDPKLEIRSDVKRPYYFIRVSVPVITTEGRTSKRTPQNLGFCDEMSVKQAKVQRAAVLSVINQRKMVAQAQLTFEVLAERFIAAELPNLGSATAGRYEGQLRLHLLPAFGNMKLCDFNGSTLQEFLIAKQGAGLGDWSLHGLKGIVSAMFSAAKRWKLWDGDNPAEGVRFKRRGAVYEKKLLTGEQLRTILAAVAERERFLILILFGLGLRISEALGLKWCDVDNEKGEVKISRGWTRGVVSDGKTENSGRVLQLGLLAQEFAKRYPGPQALDKWVFEEWGGSPPDDRDLLREAFRPVIKRLGLYYKGFGWHAFRRQNITWRQSAGGATPIEAMKAAGHGSVDMTLLYTLSDRQREADQVNRMFEHLWQMPEGGGTKQ